MSKPIDMHKFVNGVARRLFLQEQFDPNFEELHPRGQGGRFRTKTWHKGRQGEWRATKDGTEYFVPEDITPDEEEGLMDQISVGRSTPFEPGDDDPNYIDGLPPDVLEALDAKGGLDKMLGDINEYHAEPVDDEGWMPPDDPSNNDYVYYKKNLDADNLGSFLNSINDSEDSNERSYDEDPEYDSSYDYEKDFKDYVLPKRRSEMTPWDYYAVGLHISSYIKNLRTLRRGYTLEQEKRIHRANQNWIDWDKIDEQFGF